MHRAIRAAALLLMALWLLLPFTERQLFSQDASAFVAAGRLAPAHADAVYPTRAGMHPRFVREACHVAAADPGCHRVVPFLSPPQMLPLLVPLRFVPGSVGVLLVRLFAVGTFVAAGARAWLVRRDQSGELPLVVAAVLLSAFVKAVSGTGQLGGLMLLSALLAPDATSRVVSRIGWAALSLVGLFKFLPWVLLATVRRRGVWIATVALVVVTTTVALLLDPRSIHRFVEANRASPWFRNTANLSVDGLIARRWSGWTLGSSGYVALLAARVMGLWLVDRAWIRAAGPAIRWSWRWCALVAVLPVVWWFYPVVVVALAVSLAEGRRGASPWWVAVAAAVLVPLSQSFGADTLSVWQVAVVLLALVGGAVWCRRLDPTNPTPDDRAGAPVPWRRTADPESEAWGQRPG